MNCHKFSTVNDFSYLLYPLNMALGNYTSGIYLSCNEMSTNLETYIDITGKTYFI